MRILELNLINHPIIGNLSLDFTQNIENSSLSYYTIMIGPNGTGKSYILQAIINIFREAGYFLRENQNKRNGVMNGSFYLKYKMDNVVVEISNISYVKESKLSIRPIKDEENKFPLLFKVDGEFSTEEKFLPNAILASTMIFNDKFPAVHDKSLPQYFYLGIRNISSPSTAGTKALNAKLTGSLTNNINKPEILKSLNKILNNLKYAPSITISYTPKYANKFYNKNLNINTLKSMFSEWQSVFANRKTEPWGRRYFSSIESNHDLLNNIVNFLNAVELKPYGQGGKYFDYNLLSENINNQDFDVLFHLHKLDLVSYPTIQLHKMGESFGITGSSSGEQNIVFSLLTLLGNVEENSLILIDEPELSLHPNWQMQYFDILNEIFKAYKNIHFIIASHSHFLISDLKGYNSKIIGLRRDEKIEVVDLPKNLDTFGWSAENVLYDVFNVRTTRNSYFEYDLNKLISFLNTESKEFKSINILYNKFNSIVYSEKDPMNILLDQVKKYLIKYDQFNPTN